MRNLGIDYDLEKKLNTNLNAQMQDCQQKNTNLNTQNEKLADRLEHSQTGMFERLGFFFLGAGVATLVAFGAARAVR